MKDEDKAKEQLIDELVALRQRIIELQASETERKWTGEALRGTNELLEKIFSTTYLLIAYMDTDFNFIRVNRAYAEADDRESEFFVGKNHFDLYPNEENEAIFRRVVETGEPYSTYAKPFEYAEHPERGVTHWDWTLHPVKDASGKAEGLVLCLVNVTKRVEAEEELREHRDRLEELVAGRTAELAAANEQLQREITERKRAEETAAEVIEGMRESVAIFDLDGRVCRVNSEFERGSGWKREEAIGKTTAELGIISKEEFQKIEREAIPKLMKKGFARNVEVTVIHRDGTRFPALLSWTLMKDAEGKPTGIIAVARDITERKRAEEALRQYTVELEARNEELDAFVHTVAHNLKGPLVPLVCYAEMLDKDYASLPGQKLREYSRVIAQHGFKMGSIIDELLLLAEVRKMEEVTIEPLDMASIVVEAQRRVAYLIEEHQAEIISADTWPVALGYGPWVVEVWVNYLSNAIKYGGWPPRVELGATGQADGMVRFWVRDNGSGLTPEEQARLFTPFTQLAQVRAKGHGLGLSIVRRIVEKSGGQVGVESEVGRGSVFTFTLPGLYPQLFGDDE